MEIKAKNRKELMNILLKNSKNSQGYDWENPLDIENSGIIEYDLTEEVDPIYWSVEKIADGYRLYC